MFLCPVIRTSHRCRYHASMKIYTKTGDAGSTSLASGGRVWKDDRRIDAYGTIDELNSVLGILATEPVPEGVAARLAGIQDALFALGAFLADPQGRLDSDPSRWDPSPLEGWIDEMEQNLEPLRSFILPGGSRAAALAHLARAVCRRAERRVVAISHDGAGLEREIAYLNRVSDTLFVLARWLNHRLGVEERPWPGLRQT